MSGGKATSPGGGRVAGAPERQKGDLEYIQRSRQLLKDVMYAKGVSYKDLARALEQVSVEVSSKQLTNKINRGLFPLAFFLQCLDAMDVSLGSFDWDALARLRTDRGQDKPV